jgi:regulator of cell morphogenesis and NO signaling
MTISKENTIGEVVAKDIRTALTFELFGLDFCCKGNRTIEAACREAGVDPDLVLTELGKTDHKGHRPAVDYDSWPLDLLADYIEKVHHRYVADQIPVIQGYLEKVCNAHGKKNPELFEIRALFADCAGELTAHMKKEELMLFPFIRKMVQARQSGVSNLSAPFGTVQHPVRVMMHEHDTEGERFRKIAALSDQYTAPEGSCATYRLTMSLLKAFEDDLHVHIHLENNILFPKAIALEQELAG